MLDQWQANSNSDPTSDAPRWQRLKCLIEMTAQLWEWSFLVAAKVEGDASWYSCLRGQFTVPSSDEDIRITTQ